MKGILLFVASLTLSSGFAQSLLHCGSDEMESKLFQEHPEYQQAFLRSKKKLESFTKQFQENPTKSGATYIIPVVFHIIHNNGTENIDDSQIFDAVKQVNLQYRKLNPDTNQIVAAFQSIAADAQIEIRLAQIDPDGNCTSGITRTVSSLTYPGDHQVKSLIHWPPEKYLNIYVCLDAAGLAGHALMPAAADTIPQWDGIVMRHDYVGTIGTSDYFRRTVLSHEIGHYLNLYHIWGGNNVPNFYYLPVGSAGNCAYDDEVMDTPNTIGWSSCNLNANSCSTLDNVQNYMDYAYCALMFTEGQKVRMHAALNSPVAQRNNLWSTTNLAATGTNDLVNQLCEVKFESSKQIVCQGETVLFNDVSSHGVTSRIWSFESGTVAGSSSNDTAFVLFNQVGSFDVVLKVSNGVDTLERVFTDYIKVIPAQGFAHGITEGFEDDLTTFSDKWNVIDVGQASNWEITNTGFQSNQCAKINNFDGGSNMGYEFFSDPMDLSGFTSLAVAFDWAFAQRTVNNADLLQIFLSNDCGVTWQVKKTYSGLNSLKSVNQLWTLPFTPASLSEWASDTAIINNAANFTNHTQLKFRFESKGGNNFFLDNIRIGKLNELGLHEVGSENMLEVYPNPVEKAGFATVKWNEQLSPNAIELVDAQGRVVYETSDVGESNSNQIPLKELDSGYYFVRVNGIQGIHSVPLILK
ncbi:M43 family zinc metalloprotease [Fluviicola taffensis]|uniref:PKD domain containing protein n=1 Tax=Fluviicola taffensis (strain DSM 16823 / NCIMB 13979 / RW262) TaxID=755732 RepID=F2IJP8_FLUTR|nr:M43 family zinc metalloprotease [Fluviicola taffensis]AEA43938.1 PKD domain containing protein [Fluviicola taffensis DSM 16823]